MTRVFSLYSTASLPFSRRSPAAVSTASILYRILSQSQLPKSSTKPVTHLFQLFLSLAASSAEFTAASALSLSRLSSVPALSPDLPSRTVSGEFPRICLSHSLPRSRRHYPPATPTPSRCPLFSPTPRYRLLGNSLPTFPLSLDVLARRSAPVRAALLPSTAVVRASSSSAVAVSSLFGPRSSGDSSHSLSETLCSLIPVSLILGYLHNFGLKGEKICGKGE